MLFVCFFLGSIFSISFGKLSGFRFCRCLLGLFLLLCSWIFVAYDNPSLFISCPTVFYAYNGEFRISKRGSRCSFLRARLTLFGVIKYDRYTLRDKRDSCLFLNAFDATKRSGENRLKMELVRTKVLPYQWKAKCEYGFVIKTGKQEKIRYNRQ